MNYFELKKTLVKQFEEAGISETADIDWIMVEVTGKKRSMLPFYGEFSEGKLAKISDAVSKRINHIPLGLIFGKSSFYGRDFAVTNDTLIPRLDTEILIDEFLRVTENENLKDATEFIQKFASDENQKLNLIKNIPSVLDIGTGTGAIAITIQKETGFNVTAVDISLKALDVAKKNAENLGAKVEFIHSNLFSNIQEIKVDYIVSNPPYIKSDVVATLDSEVKDHEPILALDGGKDGLDFYREIVVKSKDHLNEGGMLFFEIGYDQAEEVSLLMQSNFEDIKVVKDYGNNDRVVYGRLRRK